MAGLKIFDILNEISIRFIGCFREENFNTKITKIRQKNTC